MIPWVHSAIARATQPFLGLPQPLRRLHQSSPELPQPLRGFIQRFLGLPQSLPDANQSLKEANQSLQDAEKQQFGLNQSKNGLLHGKSTTKTQRHQVLKKEFKEFPPLCLGVLVVKTLK